MTRACRSAFSHVEGSEKVSLSVRRADGGAEAAVTLELAHDASGSVFSVLAVLVMLSCDVQISDP